MNKAQLISEMMEETGLSKADAKKALDAFINVTKKTIAKEEKVTLIGFGTFSVVTRSARMGRNPRDNKPMQIPAKKIVKFKPGSEISSAVQ